MQGEGPAGHWLASCLFNVPDRSNLLSGGAPLYLRSRPLCFSFMAMVSVEFGGLTELTRAVDNYRDNINTLYGNSDQFSLGPERVLRNIVVAMYARYIDLFPVSGACVGHRALLMYSMLEFAMLIGRYGRRERQINKHLDDPVNPLTHGWVSIRSSVARRRTNVAPRWKKSMKVPCSCWDIWTVSCTPSRSPWHNTMTWWWRGRAT